MQPNTAEAERPDAPAPPVWSTRDQAWIISDHATAALFLRDPRCLSANPADSLRRVAARLGRAYPDLDAVLTATQIFQSGAMHAGTRPVVRAFQARMRTRFPKARLDDTAQQLVARLSAGEVDAVSALADALPMALFAESLALDGATLRLLRGTGQALRVLWRALPPVSLYAELDAACRDARKAVAGRECFGDLRSEAGADLAYPLADLVLFLVTMPVDSTAGTIAGALASLASSPERQASLRREPAAIAGFVQETLRLHGPNRRLHRILNQSMDIAGVPLPAGANLVIDLDRVHRDPSVFPAPERIDPSRNPQANLGFGAGAHACQGPSLGLQQAVSLVEALLGTWQIAPGAAPPRLAQDRNLRAYESLPLRLSPASPCSPAGDRA